MRAGGCVTPRARSSSAGPRDLPLALRHAGVVDSAAR